MTDNFPIHDSIEEILNHRTLSKEEKIKQLEEMLQDQLALRNASEEGMISNEDRPQISDIIKAIESLGAEVELDSCNGKYGIKFRH